MWCHNVKAEATTVFRLDPTSILDVYKVFWHLDMLSTGILGHPCSDTPLQVGGGFWNFVGTRLCRPVSRCDVMMSKLRLQQSLDWIPHPYWMYTKCFSTLICCLCIWGHPCSDTPLQVGGGFWNFVGVDSRPVSRCDVIMSKLRLQQSSDWIPHPYWMYTKCFGTLICCL